MNIHCKAYRMNNFFRCPYLTILTVCFVMLSFLGCGNKNDDVKTDAELVPYFEIFAQEGADRGIDVDYDEARIEGLLQNIPRADVLGQCFRNTQRPRKVVIDIQTWNESDSARREFLIFHELGHCFLDRDHYDAQFPDGSCRSIMHSTLQTCDFELTDDNRVDYLDELFGI